MCAAFGYGRIRRRKQYARGGLRRIWLQQNINSENLGQDSSAWRMRRRKAFAEVILTL